ncbi:MAG TPA: poly-beta-1,6-N-acetyl-D-glucosamine biosynthesis protein PgaD [Burkholderiaceae bacterium]|nr:poly-beta-1,6-N-acetyl-D-glucosamine biosynthesis protein PgaD [Burkholderiaceae bacterium]
MIITTQRSPLFLAIDTALTALGWAGFFYLFTKGVVAIVGGHLGSTSMTVIDPFIPTLHTLAVYVLVIAFNALVIVLWARFHKLLFKDLFGRRDKPSVDDETVASHFRLSCNQLHEVQESRVIVIYHSNDGDIAHLETDQLRIQSGGNSAEVEAAQAA